MYGYYNDDDLHDHHYTPFNLSADMTPTTKTDLTPGRVRARSRPTPIQRERMKILIDKGVNQGELAEHLGCSRQAIGAVLRDRHRSMGPGGLEQGIVDYLNSVGSKRRKITLGLMGWAPEASERQEDAEAEDEDAA